MHDVDVMHHQVGEDAAAEVPEPAPLAELVFVEGLVLRFAQPGFPVDVAGVQLIRRTHPAVVIAVPGQVHFVDLAKLPGPYDFQPLLEVRHAALLHPDLHDAVVAGLRRDDRCALRQVVRQRLFDVDVLARFAGGDGERHVLMIGSADENHVNVFSVQDGAVVFSREG